MSAQGRGVRTCMGMRECVVSSLCPVYFSSAGHTASPVYNTDRPVSTDPNRSGVSIDRGYIGVD